MAGSAPPDDRLQRTIQYARRRGSSFEVSDYRIPRLTRGISAAGFPRRLRFYRQRMHGAGEFRRQRHIYHAVAFDPALPLERRRHNIDPEMRLAARPVAGVALMQM